MSKFSDYIVYVDESGDANWKAFKAYPLLCVNYCLFEKNYYLDALVPKFNRLKFEYWGSDNIVLHESDLRRSNKTPDPAVRSKYEVLRGEKRKSFMNDLSALMSEADFKCFCVIIDKPKVPTRYQGYDPYDISLSRGFRQIQSYLKTNMPKELEKEIHVVFEKRGHEDDLALSKAYKQILLDGSLINQTSQYNFQNFRLELMDKKSNSTGLQIADLTARPIGNHYLHTSGQRRETDQRSIEVLLPKLLFCDAGECTQGKCDIIHEGL